jgi:hypothetical protein
VLAIAFNLGFGLFKQVIANNAWRRYFNPLIARAYLAAAFDGVPVLILLLCLGGGVAGDAAFGFAVKMLADVRLIFQQAMDWPVRPSVAFLFLGRYAKVIQAANNFFYGYALNANLLKNHSRNLSLFIFIFAYTSPL